MPAQYGQKTNVISEFFFELFLCPFRLRALSWQIVNIWIINETRDTNTQLKPWIAEYTDCIGQIWKKSTYKMIGFRIFSIVTIC